MVRIGVVGSGFMAETHLEGYASGTDAEIVAVASPNTADEFVERHELSAETFASAEEMIASADVDAIDICSPTPTHRPLVKAAAERGLDVFCEKPLASSLADAEAIDTAAAAAGITLMVGHVVRFFPQYETIKRRVESGAIGEPGVARARRLSPFPEWGRGGWYAEASGGVLLDLAIHDFDYLRWVFGPVKHVFARETTWKDGQHAHATLRFESGAAGYVEASWAQPRDDELRTSLELAGDDGLIELDRDSAPFRLRREGESVVESTLAVDGYGRELAEFVDCVETGRTPSVTAVDAIEALRISLAAKRSAERNEPVALTEVVV